MARMSLTKSSVLSNVVASLALGIAVLPSELSAQVSDSRDLAAVEGMQRVFTNVIDACAPSVVAVAQDRRRRGGGERPSPFDLDPAGLRRTNPRSSDFVPTYFGSGVVIDASGLILTNYHVLGFDNEDYEVDHYVTTSDRKVYRARIKAADPRCDLAILELLPPEGRRATDLKLKAMPLGDGGAVRRGTIVVTLGNPYAIARDGQASAGWGMVANIDRKLPASADEDLAPGGKTTLNHYGGLIQTDAKLHVGESGGALVNVRGEMIGLTTAVAAQVGYETSAGFAIAVDDVFRRALEALKAGREVEYGFLGVQPAVDDDDLPVKSKPVGIRVDRLVRGGPGEQAGLARDDWITAINGRPIATADELVLGVSRFSPQEEIRLSVFREGRVQILTASLTKAHTTGTRVITALPKRWRGVQVDFPSSLIAPQDLSEIPTDCVAVRYVAPDSPAARSGLTRGMLIAQVGAEVVSSPADFERVIATANGPVALSIRGADREIREYMVTE
jgi:serine protease Do